MASLALALPILPGKTEAVRKMFRALKNEKWNEFDKAQRKAGVKKERDFLQPSPMGDMLIVYLEQDDFSKSFSELAASKDSFDVWLKKEVKNATGIDFNQPPSGSLPELLLSWDP
jgi:hypothetical protein